VLLVAKMYMLEAHGVSEPASGAPTLPQKKKLIPIFPDVSFYLFELAALFGTAVIIISVVFPLSLPPEYSAALAGQYVAQPDWYFLWIYQILKIKAFEVAGLPVALSAVTLVFVALIALPFVDRGSTRSIASRKRYVTLGAIFVAEVLVLAIWGYLTPGQVIPNEQAALVLGGTALLVCISSLAAYRLVFGGLKGAAARGSTSTTPDAPRATVAEQKSITTRSVAMWTAGSFVGLLAAGTFFIAACINQTVAGTVDGWTVAQAQGLAFSLGGLALAVLGTLYLIYRLDLGNGTIRRRVKAFEVGWRE